MLHVDIQKDLGSFRLDVQFETEGGTMGILGESGCGKSMTLRCIAGIERPDRGRIVLDGETLFDSERKINLPPQKRQVGYLFQNYALFPRMTVRQNILCGLRGERDRSRRAEIYRRTVEQLQLNGLENRRPSQLSGGQAQRAALARILVSRPRLLMLDEPFSALDSHLRVQLQLQMLQLLRELDRQALLVTHSRDEAYHLCASIGVMEGGRFLCCKETKALFSIRKTARRPVLPAARTLPRHAKQGTLNSLFRNGAFACRRRSKCAAMSAPLPSVHTIQYMNQSPGTPDLWWRIPKSLNMGELPVELGVSPANVLPLYDK